jgi:hypothetical protein
MNKIIYAIVGLCVIGGVWFFVPLSSPDIPFTNSNSASPATSTKVGTTSEDLSTQGQKASRSSSQPLLDDQDDEGMYDQQEKPAAEIYSSSAEALAALKKGAKSYDDLTLEQFVEPGEDCAWCDSFYSELRAMVANPGLDADEKSYYAEVLSISGRVENIGELINGIESSASQEDKEIFTEALEITVGGDQVVNYLNSQLDSASPELRESMVAAISNQGSARTVEVLYENAVKNGNPDGYYEEGTGLGEVIPDEEAFPLLKKIVSKRDEYSHLAVKALINSGTEGLKNVVDILNTSPDPAQDAKLLADAGDHVSYEDETKTYLSEVLKTSENQAVVSWAKEVLEDLDEEKDFIQDDDFYNDDMENDNM